MSNGPSGRRAVPRWIKWVALATRAAFAIAAAVTVIGIVGAATRRDWLQLVTGVVVLVVCAGIVGVPMRSPEDLGSSEPPATTSSTG